jgi:hypothetical protein
LTPFNVSSENSYGVLNKVNILGTPCPLGVPTMNFIDAFVAILELYIAYSNISTWKSYSSSEMKTGLLLNASTFDVYSQGGGES